METFLVIRTKEGTLRPFKMNTIQQILAQYIAHCWHQEVPVKIMLPKSRQMGSSTFFQALFFSLCELKPGYAVATVAHDEKGSATIFGKSKTFARNLENMGWDKPAFVIEQGAYFKWHTESSLHCGTIKTGDGLGKGDTLSAIHFSESANFSDKGIDAKNAVASIMESCADNQWTIYVHESTAKGKDPFYWPMCEAARDPSSGSTYRLIFLPWFLEENYRMSWKQYRKVLTLTGKADPGPRFIPTKEEEALRQRLKDVEVRDHERYWKHNTELKDTQLIWRRAKISEMGDPDLFKRYYPSTYEEAFTSSQSCFFRPETIDYYREYAQASPPQRGYFHDLTHKFIPHPSGYVRVWERPDQLCEYVIGADIGGEKNNSDPSCAYVVEKHSLRVVASVHGHMEWDHFADTLMTLGLAYNTALLVIENNYNSAVTKRCHRKNYPNLYYYFEQERTRATKPSTPGFNTNKKTRPAMMKLLQRLLRDRRVYMPDPNFWIEMENMVWVPSNSVNPDRDGTYKATGGNHDDRIMALALALYQCPQLDHQPEMDLLPHEQTPAYRMFLKLQAEERSSGLGSTYLNLGAPSAA